MNIVENEQENEIKIKESDYIYSIRDWDDEKINLKIDLLRGIYAYGFEQPSAIQKKLFIQ